MLKTLICVAVGVAVGAIFSFVAAPLSFLVGLLTCFANYFPFFGLIGTLLPMPLLLLDPAVTGSARALAFLLPLAAHMLVRAPSARRRCAYSEPTSNRSPRHVTTTTRHVATTCSPRDHTRHVTTLNRSPRLRCVAILAT